MTVASVGLGLALIGSVLVLLLRRQLREKYAVLWIVIGLAVVVVGAVPGLLVGLTDAVGVQVPSNLLFAMSIVLLLGVALHLSWELTRSEEQIRRLAEETAINRAEIEALRARWESAAPPSTTDPTA
ncbi:hypothetical protein GCM10009710_00150 [Aeromicrobium alkaliterrae]|uniref:DUF2304 domain-containing protein n=2 Tax=Aeromicrobium alkaliterrae TaxID=302168 RepID=A0ABP4VDV1_9ACTN